MNEYSKVNWQDGTVLQPAKVTIDGIEYDVDPAIESGTTPVNATNLDKMDTALKQAHDGVRSLETNKIDKSTIELLTVSDTAPEECEEGDLYYNTTTNLIYIAIGTNTWSSTGELPSSKYLYVDLSNSKLYYYDGTTFTSYGGGSSNDVVISDEEPATDDWKIYIDSSETTDNAYYNDNGTKTELKTTTYDTLPVGAEVDFDGETVPTGWTEVEDTTTGNFTLNSNVSNGYIQYAKIGKFVQIQTEFILNSSAIPSGSWKTINLGTTSNDLKPKINTNIVCRRDTGGQTYIINIDTNGNISIKDRGTGNLQSSENIVCNGFYITE